MKETPVRLLGQEDPLEKGLHQSYGTPVWVALVAQTVKNLPAMRETGLRSLWWEDPLKKGMATHSSILAWRIAMDRTAWRTTVHGLQRVGHDLTTKHGSTPV